jgi:hypothetical protein
MSVRYTAGLCQRDTNTDLYSVSEVRHPSYITRHTLSARRSIARLFSPVPLVDRRHIVHAAINSRHCHKPTLPSKPSR